MHSSAIVMSTSSLTATSEVTSRDPCCCTCPAYCPLTKTVALSMTAERKRCTGELGGRSAGKFIFVWKIEKPFLKNPISSKDWFGTHDFHVDGEPSCPSVSARYNQGNPVKFPRLTSKSAGVPPSTSKSNLPTPSL